MPDALVLACLTWQPDDTPGPETLTVELPAGRVAEMRELIGTEAWARSEAVMWIPCRHDDGLMAPRLFRLARITNIEPEDSTDA